MTYSQNNYPPNQFQPGITYPIPTGTVQTPYPSQAIAGGKALVSKAWIQFGLPLEEPSVQTLIPLINQHGRVYGFFPVAKTTFAGTETSFLVSPGVTVAITTVTLPQTVSDNHYAQQRVQQYMAMVIDDQDERARVWLGYTSLIQVDTPQDIGYYSWWSAPVVTITQSFSRGTYLNALVYDMNTTVPANTPNPPPNPTPGTIEWACAIDPLQIDCSFIDFSWTSLFAVSPAVANPDQPGSTVIPLNITVKSNPAGGLLKAVLVTDSMGQAIYPGGGAVFDTIRILKLGNVAPGNYTFTFEIQYAYAGSTVTPASVQATLTLTVPAPV